jgi:hypothetical protein
MSYRRYVERMKSSQHLLGPNERFLLRRIEGLDGVLGS